MTEESLDPENWDEFRLLAHRMLDDMIDHLSTLSDKPAWKPVPENVEKAIKSKLPSEPEGFEHAYSDFKNYVLPYLGGNSHPRFWGWIQGAGTPFGMLADMLASGANPHMAGFNQAPTYVEEIVIEWLKELMGFDSGASGLLTSGATMGNLIGLAVARHSSVKYSFRSEGFFSKSSPKLTVYASSETHGWAERSMELLGFGNQLLRVIDVDSNYKMRVSTLRDQIRKDRANGFTPFCLLGNCGTVATGSIDDLKALGEVARQENLWFHIDGAFGAWVCINEEYRHLTDGLELADSLAFDLHKWINLPFEVGCILVRRPGAQLETFRLTPKYHQPFLGRGLTSGSLKFANLGIELTRGFKALKVWMSFKAHGIDVFRRLIGQNIRQVQYFSGLVKECSDLELMAPATLNVANYRFVRQGLSGEQLDIINQEILLYLQENGISIVSGITIQGRFSLRIGNVNHRSKLEDFENLVRETQRVGQQIAKRQMV